jgi:hypothetical protein
MMTKAQAREWHGRMIDRWGSATVMQITSRRYAVMVPAVSVGPLVIIHRVRDIPAMERNILAKMRLQP